MTGALITEASACGAPTLGQALFLTEELSDPHNSCKEQGLSPQLKDEESEVTKGFRNLPKGFKGPRPMDQLGVLSRTLHILRAELPHLPMEAHCPASPAPSMQALDQQRQR